MSWFKFFNGINQAWWHTPDISAFGSERQGDQEFKFTLSYIVSRSPAWGT